MALNGTMVKIETVTVGSGGQAAITFSSIPQTYTDLQIVTSCRSTASAVAVSKQIKFNGSSSNLSSRRLFGSGSSTTSDSFASNLYIGIIPGATATASTFSNDLIYIPNYTGSTNKSVSADSVSENNATEAYQALFAGLWSNTAAITSIELSLVSGNFAQHSTATLYGISRTTAQIKATGGTVYDDASYVYHLFTSSGTFTPSQALTADVLVVAGGGGGGNSSSGNNGGGGAGGLLHYGSQSLSATSHTVTVGSGGAVNTKGGNSVFGSLTAAEGGGRGGYAGGSNENGGAGGSGGGGGTSNPSPIGTGGTATSGQGNAGGSGAATVFAGGGGGGAGAAGTNANTTDGKGNGGAGTTTYSSWGSATNTGENISGTYYYAGGGGGSAGNSATVFAGTGGLGGGGRGGQFGTLNTPQLEALAGTANTGGGGGGGGFQLGSNVGKAGGSGIVIVRYAK